MLSFSLLVLCLNIDALSYGVATGAKKEHFKIKYIFCISILSTIMFAVPLAISKYVFNYFDEFTCHLINGIVLILLGLNYFLPKERLEKIFKKSTKICKNYKKNISKSSEIENNSDLSKKNEAKIPEYSEDKNYENNKNYSQNTKSLDAVDDKNLDSQSEIQNKKRHHKSLFKSFCECLVISVDAIFAAFLSNFSGEFYLFFVSLYAVSNFLAILIGNRLLYKISQKSKIGLDFLSGFIFLVLGVLKIIGF